ncbi:MAG: TonB-dependent receptor [Pseudomonadales bacterium]
MGSNDQHKPARWAVCAALLVSSSITTQGYAQAIVSPTTSSNGPDVVEEIVVYGRAERVIGQAASASEGIVGYDDIRLPPLLRVGELVEAVPGMVATQHSGTGKANQYFIRGFNLDHGTDFAVSVNDVPINFRTHGHGQGYLDLNFLIPELVETTRYRRGPYAAETGDFSSAASAEFNYYQRLREKLVSATVGEFGYYRTLAAGSFGDDTNSFTAAIDFTAFEGPWDLDEDLSQFKFFGAYNGTLGQADLRLTLEGYDSEWNATDQIPQRAVRSGQLNAYDNIDDDLGGETSRYLLAGRLSYDTWSINAYAIDYDFTLYSNFTYLLDDPVTGDEFEQRDQRRVYGLGIRGGESIPQNIGDVALRWGADLRFDDIEEVGLYGTSARARTNTVRQDQVEERSLSAWAESEWAVSDRLRAILGVRADWYDWDVDARLAANSGSDSDAIISPKLALAWRVVDNVEAYLNYGRGFHSNDVRGTTIRIDPGSGDPTDAIEALVESDGAEIGLRFEQGPVFNSTLTLFWLELDSELVYVGDAGTTEANDGSRRMGVEGTLFWQASDWLAVNMAYTHTNAEFRTDQGGGREIPGAVEATATLGMNAVWENGFSASARLRWLSEAPLVEDNSIRSDGSLLVNAGIAYRRGRAEFHLDIFNLLDADDNDISYYYTSRLAGEPPAGIDDTHFHPLEPRSVRASVVWRWE